MISAIGLIGGPSPGLEAAGLVVFLLFAGVSSWIAARNVFVLRRVDINSMAGAFSLYLLLGLIWATLYRFLQLKGETSFAGSLSEQSPQAFADLVYFSFVILASLGYGGIAPVRN